jgi:23S rRNA pseudouridine1911/1915/1917 synthase
MSYLGTPLYGDFIYGEEILGERRRLHCHALEFVHPVSDKKMYLSCPMPDDFDIIKGDF